MNLRLGALALCSVTWAFGSVACSSEPGRSDEDGVLGSGSASLGTGGSESGTGGGVGSGGDFDIGSGGTPGAGGVPEDCGKVLPVIFRDFKGKTEAGGHPDFENENSGADDVGCGMVADTLTAQKPVFQASYGTGKRVSEGGKFKECMPWDYTPSPSIVDATSFGSWFNTVEGVNMEIVSELPLADGVYDSSAFFPIDGQGFLDSPPLQGHNFSFTTEAHVKFTYTPGQTFTFRGDDDLWIFVNGKLAMDLGGKHGPIEGTIDFDAQKVALGISSGGQYTMDIFHAERHTSGSNFRIQTNITCFVPVPIVK